MKIAIIGSGYVGLVTGTCFSDIGIDVTCIDIDQSKIKNLKDGIIPIYEPGLSEIIRRNTKKNRLHFSTDIEVINNCNIIFICVGTPETGDGSPNLDNLFKVAKDVGKCITNYSLIIVKSTVPVGTSQKINYIIQKEIDKRGVPIQFDIASNPEFLKEGAAISDFFKPDRIIIGTESDRAKEILKKLYKPFTLNGHPIIFMNNNAAEMTKYAANSFLATKISFMNDIANLCEKLSVDIDEVRKGIGSDPRIGNKFIYSGVGYGGSCFPKDIKAIIKMANDNDYEMRILKAVENINNDQKEILYSKILNFFNNDLENKTLTIWGLSFKPQTNDMREAPSLSLIKKLCEQNVNIKVYDPVAMSEAYKYLSDSVDYCNDEYKAITDSDALVIMTEWQEFKYPDWTRIKTLMKGNTIFDGRNIFQIDSLKKFGFSYISIGRPSVLNGKILKSNTIDTL
ncbi:UDP-glucose dehydrogenase family protein [Tenacibaculum sp. C7A-26P2]|uniref:UDP-glucose dehydrogenase family protein n=1 Tax=Tenacibaculum sp. C7A-26P2 TaxID=3447504 RepID=UPI003F84EFF3